jgi:hypothetical protein
MKRKYLFSAVLFMASVGTTYIGFSQTNTQYDDAFNTATSILNRSLGSVGTNSDGTGQIPIDSSVAKFISFMQGGQLSLQPTQQQVCDAWKRMPSDQPFTGNFSTAGFEFSLDKLCGVRSVSDQSSGGAPGPAGQARFGSALKVTIDDSPYKRNGLFEDMMTDGFLYCTVKKESSYDNDKTYEENVADLVQHADALWVRQHFSSHEEVDRSPLMTVDELSMRQDAMRKADEYLCPGWPGHPGPKTNLR